MIINKPGFKGNSYLELRITDNGMYDMKVREFYEDNGKIKIDWEALKLFDQGGKGFSIYIKRIYERRITHKGERILFKYMNNYRLGNFYIDRVKSKE